MVTLAMAGVIAGSVIVFAYASTDSPVPGETASPVNEVATRPEPPPVIVEKVVDEPKDQPVYTEKIENVDSTSELEESIYVDTTNEVEEEEVPVYTEVAEESPYINEIEDEGASSEPTQSDEQEEEKDESPDESESELDDLFPKRVLDLIDDVTDFDDDEEDDDDDD
jgi:hypothetical protein